MGRQLIVVDVETTGLDPTRHSAVEVAWWNLTTDDRGRFIPPHNPRTVLAEADIAALRVNRYIDRIPGQPQDYNNLSLTELHAQFLDYDEDDVSDAAECAVVQHTLAGSNPAFDAAFLAVLFGNLEFLDDRPEPWHHRLWDLSAYAAGVLGLDDLPGLSTVCELLDVPGPDHTAEGDVTATGLCFRALQQRARPTTTAAPTAETGA